MPALPAGDRLFGLDRAAQGNPLSHIRKPPRSLMLYVVPENQTERDRGDVKGEEGRKGCKSTIRSSAESDEDHFVTRTERRGQH